MDYKKFFFSFLTTMVVAICINGFINYKYDLYGIFDKDFERPRYQYINEHYANLDFLLNTEKKYDTIIFGSSRCKNINPGLFDGYAYNLAYPAGIPNDYLNDIMLMVEKGVVPKRIFIGLDDFSYKRSPDEVHSVINFVGYKDEWSNLKYKFSLFTKKPSSPTFKYMFGRLRENKCIYNINTDGSIKEEIGRRIKDWQGFISDKRFEEPTIFAEKNNRTGIVIEEIKEIKKICDSNGIELVLFITPTHITTYLYDDIDNFNNFKNEISQICPFYDFSTINEITCNNYYWKETSHARSIVLDMVANRLNNRMDTKYPDNFCVDVNIVNVNEHLHRMFIERKEFLDKKHSQYFPAENIEESL